MRLALALLGALLLAGCTVKIEDQDFHTRIVSVSSSASAPWDVRVAFERGGATEHEETLAVPPNGFVRLSDVVLASGDYRVVASTSADSVSRDLRLSAASKGLTVGVGDGGIVSLSVIG
ncbi:MAG TPA: hypothetical protein VFH78_05190 [Candidatus Thermoplasmatota archaeon]|nr:hypothetical protein [Candidatus Thermoplasmatota archaeon]